MDNVKFSVRFVADTPYKRERGLMYAEPLKEEEAVLFTFPYSDRFAFWNKNVSFGLSLAFLNDHGQIVDIKDMDANSTAQCEPSSEARYVVEAQKGIFEKHGVQKGDIIEYADHALHVKRGKGMVKG